jgi:hypothetical protein
VYFFRARLSAGYRTISERTVAEILDLRARIDNMMHRSD